MSVPAEVTRLSQDRVEKDHDQLACEEPLEIRVRGTSVAITMRTPGHDMDLAAGFLLSEGLLQRSSDVLSIAHCQENDAAGNIVDVLVADSVSFDPAELTRHVFASSSCGLCGKASIASIHQHFAPVQNEMRVTREILSTLPLLMRDHQAAFATTGGVHAAALFDSGGKLVLLREDVGRHNAVDKVIGAGFLRDRLPFDSHILLVSGRTSFEILQKALAARIPIVCSISAPSSLAADFARESGQTLVGFLRDGGMNLYAGAQRVRC